MGDMKTGTKEPQFQALLLENIFYNITTSQENKDNSDQTPINQNTSSNSIVKRNSMSNLWSWRSTACFRLWLLYILNTIIQVILNINYIISIIVFICIMCLESKDPEGQQGHTQQPFQLHVLNKQDKAKWSRQHCTQSHTMLLGTNQSIQGNRWSANLSLQLCYLQHLPETALKAGKEHNIKLSI